MNLQNSTNIHAKILSQDCRDTLKVIRCTENIETKLLIGKITKPLIYAVLEVVSLPPVLD